MQVKISKALEGVIARTTFDTAKSKMDHSLKDCLMLQILREEGSLAYRLLSSHLKAWELTQISLRIERGITQVQGGGQTNPEEFFLQYITLLRERFTDARTISTIHALADILADGTTVSSEVFGKYGIDTAKILAEMDSFVAENIATPEIRVRLLDYGDSLQPDDTASATDLVHRFGTDLTRLAREGKLDNVVGREREIERVVQILSRRKKNNPILVGEAGVGKSAIVEGLALMIAAGKVPYTLADKSIVSLDVSSLVAGTKFRGEFEERMQQLIDELKNKKNTIIFIDEIHTIVGAGSTQGSLDTANILKPALARGELQTIGATTLNEYRENIEKDSALERRFQRVIVEPSTPEQTLRILRNIAPAYEHHHRVRYTEAALRACVDLTGRYISDRSFPDKAIDVMDEAGSLAHLANADKPESVRELEQMIADTTAARREALEAAVYDRAAAARMREIALRSRLDESREAWHNSMEANPTEISAEDVARVITSITGIPTERLNDGESRRLQGLERHLESHVIGQADAVARVARSIRRSRSGLKDENRPVGVFLFVGPTGVGKTLLAKELSKWLFDENRGLIRLDMSEYGERHNVARLIGSPPGYVGYGEGGQLTEAVRRTPYSVILFDEIEKAHSEVFNIMLQIFDEGRLTDGTGRVVDFRNTIIIMTSNVGSRNVASQPLRVGYSTVSKSKSAESAPQEEYRRALEQTFAPEFLNRIDDIIQFRSLDIADVERIVDLELEEIFARIRRLGYSVRITSAARHKLASIGYERCYGARSLKRIIAERVESPVSNMIIDGELCEGDTIVVEQSKGEVVLKVA